MLKEKLCNAKKGNKDNYRVYLSARVKVLRTKLLVLFILPRVHH
jgi:hypothetical protein